jgi:hypothetical protein
MRTACCPPEIAAAVPECGFVGSFRRSPGATRTPVRLPRPPRNWTEFPARRRTCVSGLTTEAGCSRARTQREGHGRQRRCSLECPPGAMACTTSGLCVGAFEPDSVEATANPLASPPTWSRVDLSSRSMTSGEVLGMSCNARPLCVMLNNGGVYTSVSPTGGRSASKRFCPPDRRISTAERGTRTRMPSRVLPRRGVSQSEPAEPSPPPLSLSRHRTVGPGAASFPS